MFFVTNQITDSVIIFAINWFLLFITKAVNLRNYLNNLAQGW